MQITKEIRACRQVHLAPPTTFTAVVTATPTIISSPSHNDCCLPSFKPQNRNANTGNDGLEHASLSTPPAVAGDDPRSGPDAPSTRSPYHRHHRRRAHHHRRTPSLLRVCHHAASCHHPPGTASHGEGTPSCRTVHQNLLRQTVRGTVRGAVRAAVPRGAVRAAAVPWDDHEACPLLLRGERGDEGHVAQPHELLRADARLPLRVSRRASLRRRVRVRGEGGGVRVRARRHQGDLGQAQR